MATALASNTRQSTAAWTPRRVADELRTVLHRLRATYAGLLRELQAHRDAIRAADTSAISASVHRQEQFMAEVEHADRRRREIVAGACTVFADIATAARGGAGMITVTRVINALPESDRPVLLTLANELKVAAIAVKDQTTGIRAATTSLVAHMEGLMQQVGKKLSHSGTYGRRGVVEAGGAVISGLDMRS